MNTTVRTGPMPDQSVAELLTEVRGYAEPDPPALSLPPQMFTSPEVYELERERIFQRSWIMVAHTDQLVAAGDYVALSIAGEPVAITRGEDGRLHGMSPVCRHRAMPLVEPGEGTVKDFTCSYHLWRYNLDGSLRAATYMRDNPDFEPATCRLPGFAVREWHGLIFVNLDAEARSFEPDLAIVDTEMTNYRLDDMVQVNHWTEEWGCNWKVAVENGYENYHAIGLHPETVRPLMTGGIDMTVHLDSPWVARLLSAAGTPFETPNLPLTEAERSIMYSYRMFPCGAVATFGESIAWISIIPLSLDRTQVRGGTLVPRQALEHVSREVMRKEVESITSVINAEDQAGMEAVQRTLHSRFIERGHLSTKEPGVLAFYRQLALALTSEV
ncbi:phenylpropionate dioxygenase-like ring-hydroxylating dioxygenase large terminal subunit [Nocardia tenerifensis]|uniref:Phenylpropionate dioxygenase-like ring-hydroxylating dioxygenase large terminal subunit n=1 Tax=Nocardia tenerifensis TaxID=228006 RepID=A0A318JV14_9NOCA|nr:aromatic ring-hydroxylating dioxygenase subunit alpha [Nocardia tenerifensis]PXX59774.1 phenylpropionate dioxygenase-like ring-hydroxylating dioxygenase large terminal subunit [Nocardia tenerifensis]